ncbi:hypothetical protein LTR48_008445, partial [Friedmanniomyces endolithicus]
RPSPTTAVPLLRGHHDTRSRARPQIRRTSRRQRSRAGAALSPRGLATTLRKAHRGAHRGKVCKHPARAAAALPPRGLSETQDEAHRQLRRPSRV